MDWKLTSSCESEALGDLMSQPRLEQQAWWEEEAGSVDCDQTMQVGTDLASHLSALPWSHSPPSRVRALTALMIQQTT